MESTKSTTQCVWDTLQFTWNCPCRQSMTPKTSVQILYFWKRPRRQHLLISPSIFDSWGHMRALCPPRDTPEATRSFLVDITPSRVVFSVILVPRDPCDNSEMCVRARSLVTRLLTQTGFLTYSNRMSLVALENGLMRCLRRRSSPRVSESVKN